MSQKIAFIDEFGTHSLKTDKENVSTHFIVVVIIVDQDSLTEIEANLETIRNKHFQSGEMKSSKVGSNDQRRLKVLEDLRDINFSIFGVIVDKRQVTGQGLHYKPSFYKFMNGLAYRELYTMFPNLNIIADEYGSKEFMAGFIKYVNERHIRDLFGGTDFGFVKSKSSVLNQFADFIAGTLARCYDAKVGSVRAAEIYDSIKDKLIGLKHWPEQYQQLNFVGSNEGNYNSEIAGLGIRLAVRHVEEKTSSRIPMEIDQVICLNFLLFHFRYINPNRYVWSNELINQISSRRNKLVSPHYLMSKVIAPMRDKGVLIVSTSRGYKLPANEKDLYDYMYHSSKVIQPMLSRIKRCRNTIFLATSGKIDLLSGGEFQNLRNLISKPILGENDDNLY